jgi:hypothetical protein
MTISNALGCYCTPAEFRKRHGIVTLTYMLSEIKNWKFAVIYPVDKWNGNREKPGNYTEEWQSSGGQIDRLVLQAGFIQGKRITDDVSALTRNKCLIYEGGAYICVLEILK